MEVAVVAGLEEEQPELISNPATMSISAERENIRVTGIEYSIILLIEKRKYIIQNSLKRTISSPMTALKVLSGLPAFCFLLFR